MTITKTKKNAYVKGNKTRKKICLHVMFALNDIRSNFIAKILILMFSFAGEERIYIHITKITALVVYQELVVVASPVVWVQAVQE